MKVQDLINEADSLLSDTFGERANIIRVLPNLRKQVIPFNLDLAMQKDSINNIELEPEDEVIIYKENYFFPEHPVSIAGAVRKPGKYIRTEEMTVANLVVIAGGLTESASKQDWELSRIDTNRIGTYSIIRKFNVNDNYWDDQSGDPLFLQDFDHVMVPSNPKFNLQRFVEVQGYVLYPGTYTIQQEGERLTEIIRRAGGLRPGAYLEGSTLTRKWNNAGLVPIDFIKALADTESLENIVLLDGDVINIAFKQEVVLVRGEVFVPAAVVYKKGASLKYYLNQAGGLKEEADEGRIVVMLPNGKKWEEGWFILPNPEILGGSTIYVSKKIEKEDKTLPIMRDWATIMVSIATMMIAIVQVTK
jgi:protein involved in polysaccharide export with SLBB domain